VGDFQLRMAEITILILYKSNKFELCASDLRKCPVARQVTTVFLEVCKILVYKLKADPGDRAV
jgi:hypothetical protein